MLFRHGYIEISTSGKGIYDVTSFVHEFVSNAGADSGHLICLCEHTTASLTMLGGVDRELEHDLFAFFERLAPESDDYFHNNTGGDDMPSHIKAVLTLPSVAAAVLGGDLCMGPNQGFFLLEHRAEGQKRKISISFLGTGMTGEAVPFRA